MPVGRRSLAGTAALIAAAAAVPRPASAGLSTAPNVIVFCDIPLRETMVQVGRRFTAATRVPTNVFCAAPALMLEQIERRNQNDILITLATFMEQAAQRQLVHAETRVAVGRNAYVLATRESDQTTFASGQKLPFTSLTLPDPTAITTLDSAAVLGASFPAGIPVTGAIDTEQAADIIRAGFAQAGLIFRTQAQPGSGLRIAQTLPGQPPPYEAAISSVTRSPNSTTFMTWLRSPEARQALQAAGLEISA